MNPVNKSAKTYESKQPTSKKLHQQFKPVLMMSGVVLGLTLSSCVDPGGSYVGGGQYTTYSTGYRINSLPGGYRTENISGRTYYYHDGHYYQPSSGGYTVVTAPSNSRYYGEYSSRRQYNTYGSGRGYDSRNHNDPRYDHTRVITRLPSGYREINHRGTTYYQAGDSYYSRQGTGYIVVQRPY